MSSRFLVVRSSSWEVIKVSLLTFFLYSSISFFKSWLLLRKSENFKNKREGILLKLPKPNQDLRTDLPTVGIKTVKKCANLGIKGIVVRAKHNIFLDRKKSLKIANKNNMFVSAI